MKYAGTYNVKSMTSAYQFALGELAMMEEDEPEDEVLLPIPQSELFYAKSAIDAVLSDYDMKSSAVPDGIILYDAKTIGPSLINELKHALNEVQIKALGATIGGARPAAGGGAAGDMIDRDSDGYIYDGTPQEQRVPYKRRDNKPVGGGAPEGMELRRRQFVRSEAARQGVQLNRGPKRSEQERRFRTEARARFDRIALEGQGFIPPDRIEASDKRNFENRMGDVNAGRVDDQGRSGFGYGGERDTSFEDNEYRRQQGLRDTSFEDNEDRRNEGKRPPDTSFQDNEDARNRGKRPAGRPVDRLPGAGGPSGSLNPGQRGARPDTSSEDAEYRRQQGMRPAGRPVDRLPGAAGPSGNLNPGQRGARPDTSNQRAEDARNQGKRPAGRPVDRLPGAGGPGYDDSFRDNENRRLEGKRPPDTSNQRAEDARNQGKRPAGRPVDRLPGAGGPSGNLNPGQRGARPDTSNQRAEDARNQGKRPAGRPVDRLPGAGGPGYDDSFRDNENRRLQGKRPPDTSNQRAESARQAGARPQRPVDRLQEPGGPSRNLNPGRRGARPDTSNQRAESARQNRARPNRPADRLSGANRARRFPRGRSDYYYGGEA